MEGDGAFSFLVVRQRPNSTKVDRQRAAQRTIREHARHACNLGTLQVPEDLPLEEEMRKLVYLCATARPEDQSDEDLSAFIVHGTRTTYQFPSTCRMAPLF
ncbi:hypothetical protein BKA93DRAFT_829886 [Sparassis latifolia]